MALIASELGSAIPDSGGFYVWTRRGLGRFWGFQAGWWWSLALLVDTSLYIVLSVTYLQNQIGFSDGIYYAICWSVIGVCTAVNVMGIKIVAIGSSLFAILIISPIVVLGVIGLANWQFNPFTPMTPPGADLLGSDGAMFRAMILDAAGFSDQLEIARRHGAPDHIVQGIAERRYAVLLAGDSPADYYGSESYPWEENVCAVSPVGHDGKWFVGVMKDAPVDIDFDPAIASYDAYLATLQR